MPWAEEASDAPADTGSRICTLRAEFGDRVDFDHVAYGWFEHAGEFSIEPAALRARAAKLRRWIRARPEREVVLVAHGNFNHYLTGDVNAEGEQTTPWWAEAELRSFVFVEKTEEARVGADGGRRVEEGGGVDVEGEDDAMIRETAESLTRLSKGLGPR